MRSNISMSLQSHPEKTHLSPEDLSKMSPVLFSPHYSSRREVVLRSSLPPGRYVIIPSTSDPNQQGEFLLRVLTEKDNQSGWVGELTVDLERCYSPVSHREHICYGDIKNSKQTCLIIQNSHMLCVSVREWMVCVCPVMEECVQLFKNIYIYLLL